jgi:rhamnulokinase
VPVLAGPVEAAALGNVLVQARALGADLPDLAAMRSLVARTHVVRRYDPRPRQT